MIIAIVIRICRDYCQLNMHPSLMTPNNLTLPSIIIIQHLQSHWHENSFQNQETLDHNNQENWWRKNSHKLTIK